MKDRTKLFAILIRRTRGSPPNNFKNLHDKLHLHEDDIRVIQIDGPQRKVYIKYVNHERTIAVPQTIQEVLEFHHESGELSMVSVEISGMGIRRVRVANIPPEVT